MKATIKDVARLAEVSPSTVSRALHNNPRISEEVRARVRRIAQELNFHPNQMARSLVSRESRIVGVMFPGRASSSMGHPFYPEVLRGLGQVAGEARYHVLLSTGSESLSDVEAVRDLLDSGYVSGLLFLAAQRGPMGELFRTLPMVEIGHPLDGENRYYVDNDNVQAGYVAAGHLLDRGHKRVLFLGLDTQLPVTIDRRQGVERALLERDLVLREEWAMPSRFLESAADNALLEGIFRTKDRPTAVVSMDDALSIGLCGFLQGLGLSVPADVSVVSFNNTQAGQYSVPALTSVDVNPYLLGVSAMELLLDVIAGRAHPHTHREVPFRLIERDSVALPPRL